MRFILFVVFWCGQFHALQAQSVPTIVKDYKKCMVGLQDRKHNWIAPPVYTEIYPFVYQQAIALRDGYYGVLDASGKERIPAVYTHISFFGGSYESSNGTASFTRYNLYTCYSNNRTVIIDTTGKVVLDVAMHLSTFYLDNTATGSDSAGRWYMVWLNGKIVPLSPEITSEPKRLMPGLYRFLRAKTSGFGVIDTNAHVVLQPEYDRVFAYDDQFSVIRADKKQTSFLFTPEGKPIAECAANRFDFKHNPFLYAGLLACKSASGYGVVNWKGDTILPFVYDSEPQIVNTHVFIVQKNGKYSAVTDSTYQHPFITYDALIPVGEYHTARIPGNHYFAKNKAGWNLINEKGEPYFSEAQDTFLLTYEHVLFVKNNEMTSVSFEWRWLEIGITADMYEVWSRKIPQALYMHEDSPGDTTLRENYQWSDVYEEMLNADSVQPYKSDRKQKPVNPYPYLLGLRGQLFPVLSRFDTIASGVAGCTVYVFPGDEYPTHWSTPIAGMTQTDDKGVIHFYRPYTNIGNQIMLSDNENAALVSASGQVMVQPGPYVGFSETKDASGTLIAYDQKRRAILIDSTGNVVFDTHTNLVQDAGAGLLWLGDSLSRLRYSQSCYIVWRLYDYRSRQYAFDTTVKVLKPFQPAAGAQQIRTLQGAGLVSGTRPKMLIAPVYAEIIAIDKPNRFFVVRTCNSTVGLVDATGKLLVDTIYNGFAKMLGQVRLTQPARDSLTAGDAFLFFNHTDSMALFYGNGSVNRIDSSEHDVLLNVMHAAYNVNIINDNYCRDCHTKLNYNIGLVMNNWQKEFIYHHVFDSCLGSQPEIAGYQPDFNRCACNKPQTSRPFPYNPYGLQSVTVYFTTDSLLSFNNHYSANGYTAYFVYHNVMRTSQGAAVLTLDSLFNGTAWRQIIADSVLGYLKAHPGINVDCSHPEKYPDMLQNRFAFSTNALLLYPDWSTQNDRNAAPRNPEISIPWSTLAPHLRADIKRKLRIP